MEWEGFELVGLAGAGAVARDVDCGKGDSRKEERTAGSVRSKRPSSGCGTGFGLGLDSGQPQACCTAIAASDLGGRGGFGAGGGARASAGRDGALSGLERRSMISGMALAMVGMRLNQWSGAFEGETGESCQQVVLGDQLLLSAKH